MNQVADKQYQEYLKNIEQLAKERDEQIPTFPVKDNGEKLVTLRSIKELYFDDPEDKYLVRSSVYEKFKRIVIKLAKVGYTLYVCDGYRSLEKQKQFWDNDMETTKKEYPHITNEDELKRLTARFTAPIERAIHCTGGSVDVLLYDLKTNIIIDDQTDDNYTELVYTNNPLISDSEREHRTLLCKTMEDEDFVNYLLEWWHFSYGNAEWAIYKNEPYAIYGRL